tara:strand:- start:1252 stop:1740 length:489 start_codon:yes stop_codon:yes gene_type:complete
MIDSLQMKYIIKSTLEEMGQKYASHDAMMMVYRTGIVESKYKYLMQKGGKNIARGFFQCEPWVAVSLCNDYLQYRTKLLEKCAKVCNLNKDYFINPEEDVWQDILTTNIKASIVCCRLHYWRVPKPMPKTLDGQAKLWKTHYNTHKGAGTIKHFKELVSTYE